MPRTSVTATDIDTVIRLRRDRATHPAIAAEICCHKATVQRYLSRRPTTDRNAALAARVAAADLPDIGSNSHLEFTFDEVRRMRALQAVGYGYTRITRLINADRAAPISRVAVLKVLKGRRKGYAAVLAEPPPDTTGIPPPPPKTCRPRPSDCVTSRA